MSNENTEGSSLKESVETVQDNNGEANVLKNDGSPGDNAAVSSNNTESKKRKKKVQVACVFCRRSHMICDDKRPCTRCIKRNISHLCHDEPIQSRQKKPKTGNNSSPMSSSPSNQQNVTLNAISTNNNSNPNSLKLEEDISKEQQLLRQPVNNNNTQRYNSSSNNALNNLYSTFSNNSSNTNAPRDGGNPNSGISVLSQLHFFTNQTNPFFYSEHANSEFSSLNEFLSMIDDPDVVNSVNNQYTNKALSNSNSFTDLQNSNLYNTYSSQIFNNNFPQLNNNVGDKVYNNDNMGASNPNYPDNSNNNDSAKPPTNEMPTISESAKDKFFLTAADPSTEITPEERLKQVIKAKLDAGLLQPYNYAKGYARLQNYMDNYMNQQSRQRILKPLSIFRPAFRAIARTLKDVDLVLVEEAFERMLLDYDRVFTSMAIPACLWRRTGEIYRGNKEFAQLVEVNSDALKDGKLTIYELMSEESAVNFWEKYGAIAFDKGQKAVLTSCNLRTKDGRKRKACCFSFTIRRDRYNIPSCIVGNFIPIDN